MGNDHGVRGIRSRVVRKPRWLPEELRVVDRHARELGRGRRADSRAAARVCLSELSHIWEANSVPSRTLTSVRQMVLVRARRLTPAWFHHVWTSEETEMIEPYVQACLRRDFPSPRAAAEACYAGLPARIRSRRPAFTVYRLILRLARRRGLKRIKQAVDWREARVLDRYVRALHEGRYKYVPVAAPDCLAQIKRLHRRRPDAEVVQPRTLAWVTGALYKRSEALGLPRFRNLVTPTERRLLERFARKVDRGELPNWLTAARECYAEIRRRYAHPLRLRPGGPRRLTSHGLYTIHDSIRDLSRRLNLRGPRCIRWSAPEMKLLKDWLRWYSRYRPVRRLQPLKQASEGCTTTLRR